MEQSFDSDAHIMGQLTCDALSNQSVLYATAQVNELHSSCKINAGQLCGLKPKLPEETGDAAKGLLLKD